MLISCVHYIPTSTHRENIFYGDMNPVIAENESIKFDDFEMDQTSVRRTAMSYALDFVCVELFYVVPPFRWWPSFRRILHECIRMKSIHIAYRLFMCVAEHLYNPIPYNRRTDFVGGVVWWQDYTIMKRRGRPISVCCTPALTSIN